ncbi:lytic transglycosylase domain-containing protein [Streptomyces sp. MMBL 11-1]|uniref:lytic transglycosylase domain-containing protein n=1 Tax=Streptomyces sp. MMBL 11-1 TaxID=3026420 RepID=UPI00235F0193|nr:lytic transglycosylase domain-containing protein [Streptomyces sp. MMBL 11-1]
MSRPKLPHVSWRTCRITAAAALVALLTAALLTYPADAKPDKPARTSALPLPTLHIDRALDDGHNATVGALQAQAAAQAAAHRKAEAAAAAKRKAEAEARRQAEAAVAARRAARAERQTQAAREHTQQRAARSATRTMETPSVSGARSYARARLSSTQYSCLDSLIHRESGWNHRATNPSSGAYGLMQALPASKMSSAGADWRTNPVTQIRWGLSYISNRYGSPCGAWNFWQKNRWY